MKRRGSWLTSLGLLLLSACAAGSSTAVPPKPHQESALERGCSGGDAAACFEVGTGYRGGSKGFPQDAVRAAAAFEQGCSLKHPGACDALGVMYYGGEGVPKDEEKGDSYEDRACALHHVPACMGLAYILATNTNQLLSGRGDVPASERPAVVERTRAQALRYLNAACELGNACACLALKTGDCNRPDTCSVSASNGACLVKCSEELGCDNGAFAVLGP